MAGSVFRYSKRMFYHDKDMGRKIDISWLIKYFLSFLNNTTCHVVFLRYFSFTTSRKLVDEPQKMPGFLAPGGEEFSPGPEMRLDCSELLCNKILLKYKRDRENFWHRHQKGGRKSVSPHSSVSNGVIYLLISYYNESKECLELVKTLLDPLP